MEIGETLEEAAGREIREETGLELTLYKVFSGHDFAFTIRTATKCATSYLAISGNYSGKIKLDHESSAYQFFAFDELPKEIMRHSRVVLEDFIREFLSKTQV